MDNGYKVIKRMIHGIKNPTKDLISRLKVYVAFKDKSDKPPDLIADGINVTKNGGLTFYEDEIGWYYIQGSLPCSKE
jgi:hypothetical protein